ncbi:MAG: hypothetical protein LHV69_05285 [Elusimicrobia bacterium]|nr:hypothetical protein [Candidatus Obscuribacterium magneticum]
MNKRVSIDRERYLDHLKKADNFYVAAGAEKDQERWNAAGLLIVHAAISYADAVTIKLGGVKSQGSDHRAVIDLIKEKIVHDASAQQALNHLGRIIAQKNLIAYTSEEPRKGDIESLWKNLERYRTWVLSVLGRVR